jgi:2-polyprenyl-3-methyl-5-hydroxy-6-metoxy-1,4-benzoquinol methylase
MKTSDRLDVKEWMDEGYYTPKEYEDCLYKLDRIGRFLGGDRATFWAFNQLKNKPTSILDVGCGGGLFTLKLAQRHPQGKVVGMDIAPEAIQFANQQLKMAVPAVDNLEFVVSPTPRLQYPKDSFDIVTSTLVCHHLTDTEIITFLKDAFKIARQGIILNDLHRHFLATAGFALLAPLFFRNRMVMHDGLLSIKRGFIHRDWIFYLKEAGIPLAKVSLTWHWAYRWIVKIDAMDKQ